MSEKIEFQCPKCQRVYTDDIECPSCNEIKITPTQMPVIMRFENNGNIYYKDKLLTTDEEIVEGMRKFIKLSSMEVDKEWLLVKKSVIVDLFQDAISCTNKLNKILRGE